MFKADNIKNEHFKLYYFIITKLIFATCIKVKNVLNIMQFMHAFRLVAGKKIGNVKDGTYFT